MRQHTRRKWLIAILLSLCFASGCDTKNTAKPAPSGVPSPLGRGAVVTSVIFSPNGKMLAIGYENLILIIVDPNTGREIHRLKAKLPKETERITSLSFSPDGKTLACGYIGKYESLITCWDMTAGKLKQTIPKTGISIAFSTDGKFLAGAGSELRNEKRFPTVSIWDARVTKLKRKLQLAKPGTMRTMAFSSDSKVLLTANDTGGIHDLDASTLADMIVSSWDIDTGKLRWSAKERGCSRFIIAYSPNGKFVVTESSAASVNLREAKTGEALRLLRPILPNSLTFSPDGLTLAVGVADGRIVLRNAQDDIIQRTLSMRGHNAPITSLAYSPDGEMLAAGSEDNTVNIWKTRTWKLQRTIGKRYIYHKNPFS